MKNEGMTELQRQALEHLGKARQEGLSISAYARAHGIPAQRILMPSLACGAEGHCRITPLSAVSSLP